MLISSTQLAEAILTEQAPGEESRAIVLTDTRTRRRSGSPTLGGDDHERQFLVGEDDDDELYTAHTSQLPPPREDDVRSFSSNASMDSSDSDERPKPHHRTPSRDGDEGSDINVPPAHPLYISAARTSHVDVNSLMTAETATLADEDEGDVEAKAPSGLAAKAGIIIGIHNIFIVIPQFIMTGLASITFALLDPTKGTESSDTTGADVGARAAGLAVGGGANSYVIIYRCVQSTLRQVSIAQLITFVVYLD